MSIVHPSILPGFMELLPEDQLVFNDVKKIIEDNFKKYSYLPIDTPVIEKTEVLLAKGGGETSKQVYHIESGSREMSLRFDLTVPLARYVAEHYHELEFPFRRYHIGKVYRGERNQRGRYKEFYQCDIDIIGDEVLDIRNDAEIPAVIFDIFRELNFTDLRFHINNRKVLNGFLNNYEIYDFGEVLRAIDKITKVKPEVMKEMLFEILNSNELVDQLLNFISFNGTNQETIEYLSSLNIENDLFKEGLSELTSVYEYMKLFEIPDKNIKIDLSITRGLDYYTGTVYETFLNNYESIGSVCSGGRYEDLASNYTKKSLPGIGISIGLTRLFYQLKEANLLSLPVHPVCDVLVLPMDGYHEHGVEVLNELRKNEVTSQIYFEGGKFRKKMSYADKLNIPYVIILGENEINSKTVTLRDMSSGEQVTLPLDEVINKIK